MAATAVFLSGWEQGWSVGPSSEQAGQER